MAKTVFFRREGVYAGLHEADWSNPSSYARRDEGQKSSRPLIFWLGILNKKARQFEN